MNRRRLRNFLIGFVGALALALGVSIFTLSTATTSFYYTVTDLGYCYGCQITSMNDSGQIVGYASAISNSGLNYSAFLWENGTRKGLTAFIKSSTGFHSGSVDTRAYDINNKGQAVGVSYTSYPHAVLWENDTFRDLCSVSGYAYAINNQGQVVGSCDSQSVLWDNGQIRDLLPSRSKITYHQRTQTLILLGNTIGILLAGRE